MEGLCFEFGLIPFVSLGFFLRVPKFFVKFLRWLHAESIYVKITANQIFAPAISNCKITVNVCKFSIFLNFTSCSIIQNF